MSAARLTVLDAAVLERLRTGQLRDALDDAQPDALVATSVGARNRLRASSAVPDDLSTLLVTGGRSASTAAGVGSADGGAGSDDSGADGDDASPRVHRFGDVTVAVATSDDELAAFAALAGDASLAGDGSLAAEGSAPAADASTPATDGSLDLATETYVLTDRLSLSVRPTELATEVEGLDAYTAALGGGLADDQRLPERLTHVSTALPAGYYADDGRLTLRGAAPAVEDAHGVALGGASGDAAVLTLALGPDGAVGTRDVGPDSLGLRAVHGVGPERAATFRTAGIQTRDALADADLARLADADGLGRGTAERLREHAHAHREGRVVRRGDGTLPGREPVFVDVETDGLSPSIVWLVGVLAREPERASEGSSDERSESDGVLDRGRASPDESQSPPDGDDYASFLATDPDEPGEALAAFCSWYVANASDRPIVAYNGWSFDFPVIEEQIERHCPEYLAAWQRAWRFDPYEWAVREGNAVLPGRTNQLADVAAALGCESAVDGGDEAAGAGGDRAGEGDAATDDGDDPTGDGGAATDDAANAARSKPLTGAEVGRQYRRWIRERTPAAEPDWERLEAYCEDDVRALAAVYDALRAADRTAGAANDDAASGDAASDDATSDSRPTGEQTTQGQLGDF